MVRLESKLESLENSLVKNRETFLKIRQTVNELQEAQKVIKNNSVAIRSGHFNYSNNSINSIGFLQLRLLR